jgi:signal transduction histidine kinase
MAPLAKFLRVGTLTIAFALLVAIVVIAELGLEGQKDINSVIRRSQERQLVLTELLSYLTDAETNQRNYLLTDDANYLEAYRNRRAMIEQSLNRAGDLMLENRQPLPSDEGDDWRRLRLLTGTKLGELSASLALYQSQDPEPALTLIRSGVGSSTMGDIRTLILKLRDTERFVVSAALERADRLRISARASMAAAAVLNAVLLSLATGLVTRQARKRAELTEQLAHQNEELERRVRQRTTELSALSSHLQQLAEKEKAGLARELHDELGGLLIAVKMDISWLQKRSHNTEPDMQARWTRVLKLLDDGVDFKRRVVENLRPTLLDNMGLLPALRWITQETCARGGLDYTEEYPEQEPPLQDDAAIVIFRLVQESLANIVKHAQAATVRVSVHIDGGHLLIAVEDDGCGIDAERLTAGSHGLASMHHRVRSFGGELIIDSAPGGGTRVRARLPLMRLVKAAAPPQPLALALGPGKQSEPGKASAAG